MHHFIDFKSFRSEGIELLRPLTILVGPNGSGKSNALEGIEVLAAIAAGHRFREITDLDRAGALNVRGGLQGCPRVRRHELHAQVLSAHPLARRDRTFPVPLR